MLDAEERRVAEKVREDKREGKSASTQAGEFVREEIHHVREGKHGARSPKQAIAIGLSKARRAGVNLPAPRRESSKLKTQAARDTAKGKRRSGGRVSKTRSRSTMRALKREGHSAASRTTLSRQRRSAASRRGSESRHQSAMKAVHTKGSAEMRNAARKAARTRSQRRRSA